MSLLRWIGEHRLLTALVAGLLLVWAAGCGAAEEDDRPRSGRGAAVPDVRAGSSPGPRPRAERAGPEGDQGRTTGVRQRRNRTVEEQAARPRTYVVTRVVDGDTLELGNGETVRLVGVDTPEVGECGFERASANLARLTLGREVTLTSSDEDRDRYGRLLRYVDVGEVDAGLRLIRNGLAVARYDSRDGYGHHPRESAYIAADRTTGSPGCAQPRPLVSTRGSGGCAPGYSPCVPPSPPDLDCADVDGPVRVTGSDPHGLDGDGDGTACE